MRDKFQKLLEMSERLDIDIFYGVYISTADIHLQGKYSPETAKLIQSLGFVFKCLDRNGYMEFRDNDFKIILT